MPKIFNDLENLIKTYKTIGISISGGLDSAVLTYLLHDIKYKTNSSTKFKFFCVNKIDGSAIHAQNVIDYIDTYFNQEKSIMHLVGDINLGHAEQVKSGMREAISKYDMDILVTAVTKNPESCDPPEFLPNYGYDQCKNVDGTYYNGPIRVKPLNPKFISPFWDMTKADVVKIIKDLNLTHLCEITHTCTSSTSTRCNMCWQCCERAWGFYKNDFVDIGTM